MNKQESNDKKHLIAVKPYTIKELSLLYGVDRLTFRKWLNKFKEELGERIGIYYSIPQVKIIFKHLDFPSMLEIED